MKLRFFSSNPHKIAEVEKILGAIDVAVVPIDQKIEEIQTHDVEAIVRDKTTKAFHKIGRPLFVEHTSLHLTALNGFPAGLTQVFWDTLQADRVSELFGSLDDPSVVAKTRIGFCDGKKILQFEGEVLGKIAPLPEGNRDFQWDCVFIPDGEERTFADMGDDKNAISMRKRALDRFSEYLKESFHAG